MAWQRKLLRVNLTKGTCYWINPLILAAPRSG